MADPTDIGRDLAQARAARALSLDELSRRTKIAVPVLQQIERGELAALPSGIYARGMLRAVAREVGCDAEAIVSRFHQEEAAGPDVRLIAVEPVHAAQIDSRDRAQRRVQRLVAAVLVIIGGAVYAWINGYGHDAWSSFDWRRVSVTEAAIVPVRADGPPAAAPATSAAAAVVPDRAVATNGRSEDIRVGLRAEGGCWVSATADGQRIVYGLMEAGQAAEVPAASDVVLRIGDPGALHLTINGAAVRPIGRAGEPVTVHLTRENYREWLQP